jgi:hypothetical protein
LLRIDNAVLEQAAMVTSFRGVIPTILAVALSAALGGCHEAGTAATADATAPPAIISALNISGTPATGLVVGDSYTFQPVTTQHSTGQAACTSSCTFSISNKPAWMSFNTATGKLSGVAAASNVGSFSGIVIGVNDGGATAALPPFSITVTPKPAAAAPVAPIVASVSWMPPAAATGQATPPAGYRIYYGTGSAEMTHAVDINDPNQTSHVVVNLTKGTWYFAIASYDAEKIESILTPTVEVAL